MKKFSWTFLENRISLAKKYLSEGDRVGACALAGAVLETSLRNISLRYDLKLNNVQKCTYCGNLSGGANSIGKLIEVLCKEGKMNMELQSYLDKCRIIRNTASHGYFGDISVSEAKLLISGAYRIVQLGKKHFFE